MLSKEADYYVPLLRLLAEMPGGGGSPKKVAGLFWQRYQTAIPREHQQEVPSGGGEIIWSNRVAWSRNALKKLGLLDGSVRNVWRITDAGRKWLADNPEATHLTQNPQRAPRPTVDPRARYETATPHVTRQSGQNKDGDSTLAKLERIRQVQPAEQFREDWGELYDQLRAEARARAITALDEKSLSARASEPVKRIQDFLQERSNDKPTSETICDWIHLCYTLELWPEGASLWQYIHPEDVNPWYCERTKKLAQVCRSHI